MLYLQLALLQNCQKQKMAKHQRSDSVRNRTMEVLEDDS